MDLKSGCVLLFTQFRPSAVGHGGEHRTYQIVHDLREAVGADRVHVLSLPEWRQKFRASRQDPPIRGYSGKVRRKFRYRIENPWRLWHRTEYLLGDWASPSLMDYYRQMLSELGKPAVVIIEHSGFADIVSLNVAQGIATVACIQNLESLDLGQALSGLRYETRARMGDLATETDILARCSERLFISKVEAGLIGGMGLTALYYPYRPVGAIRENLCRLRQERAMSARESGLFLMVGSAGHNTTREAFGWFVHQVQSNGLPTGMRIVVGGYGTDKLLPNGVRVPGLELRGWLSQEELDHLLITAEAVLVPQFRGFGALTRLSELACAGIPMLVSRHATFALDIPSGIMIVDDNWSAWRTAMSSVVESSQMAESDWETYLAWEQAQPRALSALLTER